MPMCSLILKIVLQQQIAHGDVGYRYPMLQLEQQMVSLVSSTQNMQTQMAQLQKKLQDEHQRNRRQLDEIENLRSKFSPTALIQYIYVAMGL
jgi:uncharacterized protein YlxW (UPF0749 family)